LIYNNAGIEKFFVVDFYCIEKKLAIEVDGEYHIENKELNIIRTDLIKMDDIKVIRFENSEVESNILNVIDVIKQKL